jgi:subtilisin family serine protease
VRERKRMKRRVIPLLLVALMMVLPLLGAESGSGTGGHGWRRPAYAPGELLVKYKPAVRTQTADYFRQRWGVSILHTFRDIGVHHVKLPAEMTVEEALDLYRNDPDVEYAEPNYYRYITATPDDTDYQNFLWGMNNTGQTICPPEGTVCPPYPACVTGTPGASINAPSAWDVETDCTSVTVAIIDTGVDYNHRDLAANIASGGYDFVDNDNAPMDPNGHGTHVAGTIGAVGNNSLGVTGVCWTANLLPLRAFDASGIGTDASIIAAMAYARTNGAKVINASYGGSQFSQAEYNEISNLNTAGVLLVAATADASANSDSTPTYPASYGLPNIIAVAATDQDDNLACFSNYGGASVHVAAPGVNIYSTMPGRQTVFSDNFDNSGISDWTVDPHWSLSNDANSLPNSLALVPGDAEGKGADLPARPTNAIDLSSQTGTLLTFKLKGEISGGDLLYVETAPSSTGPWTNRPVLVNGADFFDNGISGSESDWADAAVDLGPLDGTATAYFRFRYHTNAPSSSGHGGGGGGGCFIASAGYGSRLPLAAPRALAAASVVNIDDVEITTSAVRDNYQFLDGTSMATAHVTGLAALVWSYNLTLDPTFTSAKVKERILNCVDRLTALSTTTPVFTQGRINAFNSIQNLPARPVGLVATPVSRTQINLKWANTYFGQIGFRIERQQGAGSFTQVADISTNTTSYADTGLLASTPYNYRVRAYSIVDNHLSNYSDVATATTLP